MLELHRMQTSYQAELQVAQKKQKYHLNNMNILTEAVITSLLLIAQPNSFPRSYLEQAAQMVQDCTFNRTQ